MQEFKNKIDRFKIDLKQNAQFRVFTNVFRIWSQLFPHFKFRKLTCESNDLLNKHLCLPDKLQIKCNTVNLIRLKHHIRNIMLF